MVKTAKNHHIKKMELVEIAERLFVENGYEETSIDEILKAADLSKGGFYHYFQSKEEVLRESINSLMDSVRSELEATVADPQLNALDKLNLFLQKRKMLQLPKREFTRYMAMIMKSEVGLYRYYVTLSQTYLDPLAQIIEQGVQEGRFQVEFPRETADIILRAVTSLPQSPLFQGYLEDETKAARYRAALASLIARTLGIDNHVLRME